MSFNKELANSNFSASGPPCHQSINQPVPNNAAITGDAITPKIVTTKSIRDFQHTLDWGVRFVIFLGLPAMVGLMIISPLIITVLFDHGAFKDSSIDHVKAVSLGVVAYSVGLVSFMLIKVLAPGFYARQDTKTVIGIKVEQHHRQKLPQLTRMPPH